mmetsp:Transcript_28941/g.69872  ORF Transcript_28941/g.69872 Transcript_28941/m.69872 type:complete len:452 (-) Transcript_28941:148-1503(-)
MKRILSLFLGSLFFIIGIITPTADAFSSRTNIGRVMPNQILGTRIIRRSPGPSSDDSLHYPSGLVVLQASSNGLQQQQEDEEPNKQFLIKRWKNHHPLVRTWNVLRTFLNLSKVGSSRLGRQLRKRVLILALALVTIASCQQVSPAQASSSTTTETLIESSMMDSSNEVAGVESSQSLDGIDMTVTKDEEMPAEATTYNKNDKSSSSSPIVGKASATAVMVATGAHVFRLNRKQRRLNDNFESWNASWNATTTAEVEKPSLVTVAAGRNSTTATTMDAEIDLQTVEIDSNFQSKKKKDENDEPGFGATPEVREHTDAAAAASSAYQSVPRDDVMKATVEAMKKAGGESTTLEQGLFMEKEKEEESSSDPVKEELDQEEAAVVADLPYIEQTETKQEEKEEETSSSSSSSKYPKERMPIVDPAERAKVSAKYAAIESLEDRAFQILVDLGMI